MRADILCQLIAKQIPAEHFQIRGLEVVFTDPEESNKPFYAPNESPYNTAENRKIVKSVIDNYDSLAEAFLIEHPEYKEV